MFEDLRGPGADEPADKSGVHEGSGRPELDRVRVESREFMLRLFDATDKQAPKPERKAATPIQIATFEA